MAGDYPIRVWLDPQDPAATMQQLSLACTLPPNELAVLLRIIELFPRPAHMLIDTSQADNLSALPFADRFSFDLQTDELLVFAEDSETLVDALIEMAMFLTGFATKMGNPEHWVIDFTIGAWKPVRRRIKRQLGIPVADRPRGVVGLRPDPGEGIEGDPYPFRTLVSYFDQLSFQQMVMLAARDDIAVHFPPGTHPKVRAVYVHVRRAIEEVGQYITLDDFQVFNLKLNNALRRIEELFDPAHLEPPNWLARLVDREEARSELPPPESPALLHAGDPESEDESEPPAHYNPFEAFIEQLFSDEDE